MTSTQADGGKSLDRLYKRTATGAIQIWEVEVDEMVGRYRTISGQLEGKQVVSEWTQCKAKNLGRANAVSACEQAAREAKAAWEKKQRDGYSLTVDDAHGSEAFQCMLAKGYDDPKRKAQALTAMAAGNLFSQPKLDGVRLIATKHSFMSRKNREIVAVPHIQHALADFFEAHPGVVLDGELYNHNLKDDFDSLVSLVRKTRPSDADIQAARVLEYHVYDVAGEHVAMPYSERYMVLRTLLEVVESPHIQLVPTILVQSEEALNRCYAEYLDQGYEGQMLRIDALYENKRSDKLLKRKEFEDKEFEVVDISEGEGNRSGQAGYVQAIETGPQGSGVQFSAGIKAPLEKRIELLRNAAEYRGGEVTIRFNGRTPKGVPRFPRAIAWYPGGRTV